MELYSWTVFSAGALGSSFTVALISGCLGCWIFWQDSSSHCHHGLHLIQPGNDLRWNLYLYLNLHKTTSNLYLRVWFLRSSFLYSCPVLSCWSDCCWSVWRSRGRRSGIHVWRSDPSQPQDEEDNAISQQGQDARPEAEPHRKHSDGSPCSGGTNSCALRFRSLFIFPPCGPSSWGLCNNVSIASCGGRVLHIWNDGPQCWSSGCCVWSLQSGAGRVRSALTHTCQKCSGCWSAAGRHLL